MRNLLILIALLFLSPSQLLAAPLKVAMGSNYPPMHFTDSEGKLVGFEVDLVNAFARQTGQQVVFVDPAASGSSTLELVRSGEVDFAVNSVTITDQRKKLVDFSAPYFASGTGLLVNAQCPSETHLESLIVHVPEHSLYDRIVAGTKALGRQRHLGKKAGVELILNERLPRYQPYAFAYDWSYLAYLAKTDPRLKILPLLLAEESYGAVFGKGQQSRGWDRFISEFKQSGSYQQLYAKWFGDITPPQPGEGLDRHISRTRSKPETTGDYRYMVLLDYPSADTFKRLVEEFRPEDVAIIRELLVKHHFQDFALERFIARTNLAQLLPEILDNHFHGRERMELISALVRKNPGYRQQVQQQYLERLAQRQLTFEMGTMEGPMTAPVKMKVRTPAGKERLFASDAEISYSFDCRSGSTCMVSRAGKALGELLSMELGDGDSYIGIFSVDDGLEKQFSVPALFSYAGISDDGRTIFLEYSDFIFSLSVSSGVVTAVQPVQPWEDTKTIDLVADKLPMYRQGSVLQSEEGEFYLIEKAPGTAEACRIARLDPDSGEREHLSSYYGNGGRCGGLIMDGTLFSTAFGYDDYQPLMAVDIATGLKLESNYGGGIVPVGAHELYYCSVGGYEQFAPFRYLLDTRTLERTALPDLPCPAKSGALVRHPLPRHFIFINWSMC